jgi:hypothetical protein
MANPHAARHGTQQRTGLHPTCDGLRVDISINVDGFDGAGKDQTGAPGALARAAAQTWRGLTPDVIGPKKTGVALAGLPMIWDCVGLTRDVSTTVLVGESLRGPGVDDLSVVVKSEDLLATPVRAVGPRVVSSARWPKTPKMLGDELRRIGPRLRKYGLHITSWRCHHGRIISIDAGPNTSDLA